MIWKKARPRRDAGCTDFCEKIMLEQQASASTRAMTIHLQGNRATRNRQVSVAMREYLANRFDRLKSASRTPIIPPATPPGSRSDKIEPDHDLISLFEHDLSGKPVPTPLSQCGAGFFQIMF
jgi:hypothetical protein